MKNFFLLTASVSFLALGAHAQPITAQQGTAPAAQQPALGTLIRNTTFRDLGFSEGVSFTQLSGQSELFFPIPDAAPLRAGELTLNIEHGATNAVERYLQVKIGNRIAASIGLEVEGGKITLPVEIRPDDIRNGFLTVGLAYSGAFSEFICVDERASGDFVQIAPDSALSLTLDASEIDTPVEFNGFRPSKVYVKTPSGTEVAGLAALVRAATLFGAEQGGVAFGAAPLAPDGAEWTSSAIALDVTTTGPESEMEVVQSGTRLTLQVSGTDPQLGLSQLASQWAGLADGDTNVVRTIDTPTTSANSISLATLGGDLREKLIISSDQYVIPFQSSDLPAGKTVSQVDLMLAAALDPSGTGASATIYLNDTLLGARSLERGQPERVKFDVPDGLISRDNVLRVSFQRQPSGGQCRVKPQGFAVQLLPGSTLELKNLPGGDESFFQLRQEFSRGAQVFVDPTLELSQTALMPWLGSVAGTIIPDSAPIIARNALVDINADAPFLIVSAENPGDGEPLITADKGRIEIRDRNGDLMFDGEALERFGIVQMITRNGVNGIWLRPGTGPAPDASQQTPFVLDRGDFALVGQEGVVVSTSTRSNSLIDVVYPDQTTFVEILDKYRPWIVGSVWLALTLMVLAVFQRIYRRRRDAKTDA
ncbi:MAG: cellulose biosynthesis cyclic di-GMP-binding regulatory protein BcsB [Sulfitobacter sp.]